MFSALLSRNSASPQPTYLCITILKELYFNVSINSGVYALWIPHSIVCIFSSYLDTVNYFMDEYPVINSSYIDFDRSATELRTVKFYKIGALLNKNTSILRVYRNYAINTVSSNTWAYYKDELTVSSFKLIKLN